MTFQLLRYLKDIFLYHLQILNRAEMLLLRCLALCKSMKLVVFLLQAALHGEIFLDGLLK